MTKMSPPPHPLPPPNPNNTLAVAFTDVNGDGKFQANTDKLIAAVVDTNNDKTIDAGDTVQFGTYPLHVDGTGSGNFTHATEQITAVLAANSANVVVETPEGFVQWVPISAQSDSESFQTGPTPGTTPDSLFFDEPQNQIIQVTANLGPGAPDTNAADSGGQLANQPFLDVFIA
jgi:hypothetical protein